MPRFFRHLHEEAEITSVALPSDRAWPGWSCPRNSFSTLSFLHVNRLSRCHPASRDKPARCGRCRGWPRHHVPRRHRASHVHWRADFSSLPAPDGPVRQTGGRFGGGSQRRLGPPGRVCRRWPTV